MKKRIIRISLIALVLFLGFYTVNTLVPSIDIATGYVAKYSCSYTFIGKVKKDRIASNFTFFPINQIEIRVNKAKKYVEASLFGMFARRAYYYEKDRNCGCVLDKPLRTDKLPNTTTRTTPTVANYDTIPWPVGDKVSNKIPKGVQAEKLNAYLAKLLQDKPASMSAAVIYKGQLVAEQYADGITPETRLLGWSMTKTIGATLVGILDKNNLIDINVPAPIDAWKNDERKNITTRDLLQMSSGLKWEEDYSKVSGVTQMLYLTNNVFSFAIHQKLETAPTERWYYSSGTSNILDGVIEHTLGSQQAKLSFPYDSLFDAIGMRSATIEMDHEFNYMLSSYAWANTRDWARFGQLYLQQGQWNGRSIFTKKWAKDATKTVPAAAGRYGYQIWLNGAKTLSDVPEDAYWESGYGGQRILIIPSREIVIVLLSGYQTDFEYNKFYRELLQFFE